MSHGIGGRLGKIERGICLPESPVRWAVVVDDPHAPVDPEELRAYLRHLAVAPLTVAFHADNGRGEQGANVFFGGQGWWEQGPLIRGGHLVTTKGPRPA